MAGDPKFEGSQNLPDFPYARYGELLGFKGIRVDRPEQIGPAWDEALAADRPVVLEAYTDANVPPLPPHISLKHAKAYVSALFQGDPEATGIIKQSLKEMAETIAPGTAKGRQGG